MAALSIAHYLERWLLSPDSCQALGADRLKLDLVSATENCSLTYRWREAGSGTAHESEESLVTFAVTPHGKGTRLRLTHEAPRHLVAANCNVAQACAA